MKNWKKVILGVALSFMVFFTAIGYAALTDELTISGTLNASAPEGVFITNITLISGASTAEQTDLRSMDVTLSGKEGDTITYAIEFKNNTSDTYVYTGANDPTIIASNGETGSTVYYTSDEETAATYVSGIPIEAGKPLTINIQYTLLNDVSNETVSVEFYFKKVDYTITYINDSKTLDVRCVLDYTATVNTANDTAKKKVDQYIIDEGLQEKVTFNDIWMNAGSTQKDSIIYASEEEVEDVILYPIFDGLYTATFVTQDGKILGWTLFTANDEGKTTVTQKAASITAPPVDGFGFDYWQIQQTDDAGNITKTQLDNHDFTTIDGDITIYPAYKYSGDVKLIPVDSDGDGATNYYEAGGYGESTGEQELVVIPNAVNDIPVTTINAGSFSSYDDLHAVVIPASVQTIGGAAFADDDKNIFGGVDRQTVTLYYEGTPEQWAQYMKEVYTDKNYEHLASNWDENMGQGSRVFFLVDGKVDLSKGYWELDQKGITAIAGFQWLFHDHTFPYSSSGATCSYDHNQDDTNYAGACDCDSCNGTTRPDANYWDGVATTSTFGLRETLPEDETTP